MLQGVSTNGFCQLKKNQILASKKRNLTWLKFNTVMQGLMKKPTMCQWTIATASGSVSTLELRKLIYHRD